MTSFLGLTPGARSDKGAAVVISDRRRTPILRVTPAIGAILLASLVPTVQALATPHMEAAVRDPQVLHRQVVGLFDQLDQVSRAIEGVRADIASARGRITELVRQIDAQQRILNRRAAEAYMSLPAVGVDALLGASSFTDLQDALEFLDAVSRRDQEVLLSLLHRKTEVELQRARLEGLEAKLRGKRERLEATVADLVEKLQQRRAPVRQPAGERAQDNGSVRDSSTSPPPPTPSPPNPAPGRETVTKLIRKQFASLGTRTGEVALCVAETESGLDPLAVNPVTGASGLFQFIPSTWASLSELAGWGGASVFDARANAAVAAWTVAHYGWHPWRSVAADCSA
jgi:phage shock protein A